MALGYLFLLSYPLDLIDWLTFWLTVIEVLIIMFKFIPTDYSYLGIEICHL